jgi:hypothetical protein
MKAVLCALGAGVFPRSTIAVIRIFTCCKRVGTARMLSGRLWQTIEEAS